MNSQKHRWIPFTLASVLAVFVAMPAEIRAEEPMKQVRCRITEGGKSETKQVASAEECAQMGGKVVRAQPYNRHNRHKK
jgi:starvation-inducible outer membrane lipoprotein